LSTSLFDRVFVPRFLRSEITIMRRFTCGLGLALLSSCLLGLAGCAEDNEKTAGITGKEPEGASTSYADAMAKMKGAPGGGGQGYPGAKRQEAIQKKAEQAQNK
jgi:hypothetical protein